MRENHCRRLRVHDGFAGATWHQLGAAIDSLDAVVLACPDDLWPEPPQPFTLDELDPAGVLPERRYSRHELRAYLASVRDRAKLILEGLTSEEATRPCQVGAMTLPYVELFLCTMRHVQEHAAQLSMLLGRTTGAAPRRAGRAR